MISECLYFFSQRVTHVHEATYKNCSILLTYFHKLSSTYRLQHVFLKLTTHCTERWELEGINMLSAIRHAAMHQQGKYCIIYKRIFLYQASR
jgi:hypothetical protein